MEKYPLFFQSFLVIILLLKVVFLICVGLRFYAKKKEDTEQIQFMDELTEQLHKSYSVMMSILLILLFSNLINSGEVCIDGHLKTYLSTFGILSFFDFLNR